MDDTTSKPETAQTSEKAWEVPAESAQSAFVKDNAPLTPNIPPGPNHEERLADLRVASAEGRNVLMLASDALLRALAEVPQALKPDQVTVWHKLLAQELTHFTRLCEQLNVRRDHMLAVRYVLCTALDEAASLAPWNVEGDGMWANKALLPQFHGEREGGEVVFMLVGRMAHAPQEHLHVLELVHHVLSLGFAGSYATKPDGHRQLQSIRHRLFTMVSASHAQVPRELSARWRGASAGKFRLLRAVPVWASASLLGLVLLGQFSWSKYQLLSSSAELQKRIHALKQLQPPEKVAAPAMGLAQLLGPEIASGRVTVTDDPTRSVVVFKGDGMFAAGQATLSDAARQTVEKVGQAVQSVAGKVSVTGHTDNLPNPDPAGINRNLSLGRATEVAKVLQAQGVTPERLSATGQGAQAPVASNDSAAGRAQNRRVVIEVMNAAQ